MPLAEGVLASVKRIVDGNDLARADAADVAAVVTECEVLQNHAAALEKVLREVLDLVHGADDGLTLGDFIPDATQQRCAAVLGAVATGRQASIPSIFAVGDMVWDEEGYPAVIDEADGAVVVGTRIRYGSGLTKVVPVATLKPRPA